MVDAVESMAYAGKTPWHGLGTKVENSLTTDEMLVAAGLDWTVSKRRLWAEADNTAIQVPGYFGLTRDKDNHVLSIVGSKYKPVQNTDAMDFFNRFVSAGKMQMETAGSLHNGQYIWGLAKINKTLEVGSGDVIDGYLLLMSPHIFGWSMVFQFTPVRVVCWNTLNMALGSNLKGKPGSYRVPHSRLFDANVKRAAEEALGLANNQMQEFVDAAKHLSTKRVSNEEVTTYFHEVANLPESDEDEDKKAPKVVRMFQECLENGPGQRLDTSLGTWWGAVNAVTYVADHELGRTRDNGLTSAWFGQAALMKRKALHLALKAVE